MSHTPGPWRFQEGELFDDMRLFMPNDKLPSGEECVMCDTPHYPWCPSNPDDWRLIAAAPDLLAACKHALEWDEVNGSWLGDRIRDPLEAAIAKAEGR
jgi:hypothetical protein